MSRDFRPIHGLLAVVAVSGMVTGLSSGFARLGIFESAAAIADRHAAFVLCGFFGTLISLERAVASGTAAALWIPGLAAAASLLLWLDPLAAGLVFVIAGAGLASLCLKAALSLRSLFSIVLTVGALLWPLGTLLWLVQGTTMEAGYVWLGFLILTITAERIELARLRKFSSRSAAALAGILLLFCIALLGGEPLARSGPSWLLSVSLAGLAIWLLGNDIALITLQGRALARYSAVALLCGYGWLLVAALGLVLAPPSIDPEGHDLYLHAIGLGFVLSMVFAHAPIILPAVTGLRVSYSPALYLPLALLQGATALRVGSDLSSNADLRPQSAWLTLACLVLYALLLARTLRRRTTTAVLVQAPDVLHPDPRSDRQKDLSQW
jgi:hypothetical protein